MLVENNSRVHSAEDFIYRIAGIYKRVSSNRSYIVGCYIFIFYFFQLEFLTILDMRRCTDHVLAHYTRLHGRHQGFLITPVIECILITRIRYKMCLRLVKDTSNFGIKDFYIHG